MFDIERDSGKLLNGEATSAYFPLSTTKSGLNKSKSQPIRNCLKEIAPKPSPTPHLNLNQFVQNSTFLTSATIDNEISRSSNTAFVLIPIKSISSNNILNCQSFSDKASSILATFSI
uniref:Uncharacterized protein n=1 Tax=Romanomermis culicivorax TaxID=13658 RepID=A0A915IJK7_ROMCU